MRCKVLVRQKAPRLQKQLFEDEEVAEDGLGSCECVWIGQTVGTAPTERVKLTMQMAAAGKKESVSLSLCIEVNNVEFEEDTSTVANALLRAIFGKMEKRAAEGVEGADL